MTEFTVRDPVAQAAPHLRIARFNGQVEEAVARAIRGATYVGGPVVATFERDLEEFLSAAHVVSCNSGTDALAAALIGLGIGEGDEVVVPSMTAAGSCIAVLAAGATPRFADVDLTSKNISISTLQSAMTPRVRAVIAVHLHGNPLDMDPILAFARERSLFVVEDCAQAIGATYKGVPVGTLGDVGAFSFYPTKNLGALGDGGAVAVPDPQLADQIRTICNCGWNENREVLRRGFNSRLDVIQAAVLSTLLPHVVQGNAERQAAARVFDEALLESAVGLPHHSEGSVFHQYAVRVEDRAALEAHLASHGIGTGRHYDRGLHQHSLFRSFVDEEQSFPNVDILASQMVSLPIQSELMSHQERIISAVKGYTLS